MKMCSRCNTEKPLIKFKKYTTKAGEVRHVSNCQTCASLELKLSGKIKKQQSPSCKHCACDLVLGENWHPSMKKECCYVCKACHKSYSSQSAAKNKHSKLGKHYGITLEQYNEMYSAQGGLCAICKQPERFSTKNNNQVMFMPVDHDHKTGEVRGLLCTKCNRGLGLFEDNPEYLNSAIEYLKNGGALE